MAISFDMAREAKAALRKTLKKDRYDPPWLRGIGIAKNLINGDHYLQVMVHAPGDENHLPKSFSGVRVVVSVVGDIQAQS